MLTLAKYLDNVVVLEFRLTYRATHHSTVLCHVGICTELVISSSVRHRAVTGI